MLQMAIFLCNLITISTSLVSLLFETRCLVVLSLASVPKTGLSRTKPIVLPKGCPNEIPTKPDTFSRLVRRVSVCQEKLWKSTSKYVLLPTASCPPSRISLHQISSKVRILLTSHLPIPHAFNRRGHWKRRCYSLNFEFADKVIGPAAALDSADW